MRKLILGIIAVTLLQIAFFLGSIATTSFWTVTPPVAYTPVHIPEAPVDPERTHVNKDHGEVLVAQNTSGRRPTRIAVRLRSNVQTKPRATRRPEFPEQRVIQLASRRVPNAYTGVGRSEATAVRGSAYPFTENPSATSAEWNEERRVKKRSLIAKVFTPLVKKPWQFLKAVGSKLN